MNLHLFNAKIALTVILISVCTLHIEAQITYSRGVIAPPKLKTLTQNNGSQVKLYIKGDGIVHWFETTDEKIVLRNQNGNFMYAILDEKGNMIPSNHPVKQKKSFFKRIFSRKNKYGSKDIFFSKEQLRKKKARLLENSINQRLYTKRKNSINKGSTFPTSGKQKMLTILAEFSDQEHKISRQTLDDLMNKPNYNNTGSFKDYYLEASNNSLDISTTVTKWVRLPHSKAYYGKNDSYDEDSRPREFIRDAIKAALEAGIDFSPFDNDKDSYIDFLQVIHSGVGEEGGEDADAIWSHQWTLSNDYPVGNDKYVRGYVTVPELYTNTNNTPSSIGVSCHEFGHALGLMDYYDTDYGDSGGYADGLGSWELMDSGCWNNEGKTPAHTNIYSKYLLGWANLPELYRSGNYELSQSNKYQKGYQIKTNKEDEFFVLDNRQKIGFDKYIPYHGMLIYRINRSNSGWENNKINIDPKKEGLKLIKSKSYGKDCPFPGNANITSITDITSPANLKTSSLDYTYKGLLDIKEKDEIIFFNYYHNNRLGLKIEFHITSEQKNIFEASINLIRKNSSSPSITPQTTDKNGIALFDNVFSGSYIIEITKNGYKQFREEINIYRDQTIEKKLTKKYNLTINISYKGLPIENVEVSIESEEESLSKYPSLITDYKGNAIFEDIILGNYTIIAKKYNYFSFEKSIQVENELTELIELTPFSIIDAKNKEVRLYPNPSDGEININIELSEKAIIRIFDIKGQLVHQHKHTGGMMNSINLTNLSTGVYIFVLIDKGTTISKTLIIK